MLPKNILNRLIDKLSIVTMRYLHQVENPDGLVARVLQQVKEDFFVNGTITSHTTCPELMAGQWCGSRESVLVSDQVDLTTKAAMGAAISQVNDCPYCNDMFISLVHSGHKHLEAKYIGSQSFQEITDIVLRNRLLWAEASVEKSRIQNLQCPFSQKQLPEVIATVLVFHYNNRFNRVVMDGSPIVTPMGSRRIKNYLLRAF